MENPDADFIRQLFRDNNELRARVHALDREIYYRTVQLENTEDELRQLKYSKDDKNSGFKSIPTKKPNVTSMTVGSSLPGIAKELEEAMYSLDKKNNEIRKLKEESSRYQNELEKQEKANDYLERELAVARKDIEQLRSARDINSSRQDHYNDTQSQDSNTVSVSKEVTFLKHQAQELDEHNRSLKSQLIELAAEANQKNNEKQNQIHGLEALLGEMKRQYDQFIQLSKIENDALKKQQQEEYETLRIAYEQHKREQFEEKRQMTIEYQGMLYTMQTVFDEYRKTAEFLFNSEVAKLQDELMTQAMRYENEILYIVQTKDKFYADMMVSKDAKIMNLIEGSDLQSLLQKHEMDIENIRRDYSQEIERIKSQQDSEQKQLISLLQRQNQTLESKCEKLQLHVKTLETKLKECLLTVDSKNKSISEKDDHIFKLEQTHQSQIQQMNSRISALSQEKEYLRHKVIRMNRRAKGEGENSIENMLKRISRETTDLSQNYADLSSKYEAIVDENLMLMKKLKDRERMVDCLEIEVQRRTEEYSLMTRTFEEFLANRNTHLKRERNKRLSKLQENSRATNLHSAEESQKITLGVGQGLMKEATSPVNDNALIKNIVRVVVPETVEKYTRADTMRYDTINEEKQDLERGNAYLRRFKKLSKAFATGDFKNWGMFQNQKPVFTEATGETPGLSKPWDNIPLYSRLEYIQTSSFHTSQPKLYGENTASNPTETAQVQTNRPRSVREVSMYSYEQKSMPSEMLIKKSKSRLRSGKLKLPLMLPAEESSENAKNDFLIVEPTFSSG
ncbi:hypothetical protein BKA69DRAFT_1068613 [Paraphysoderma sedebokerense]|nr:hypothetical protein BKA69DRAFT_1068613 [Paraphysoderma sedebokerense]